MRSALRSLAVACGFLLVVGLVPFPAAAQSDKSDSQLRTINDRVLELHRAGKFAEAIPLAKRYADAVKTGTVPTMPSTLPGAFRFITSKGDQLVMKPGDSLLETDTTGKGHVTEVLSTDNEVECLII